MYILNQIENIFFSQTHRALVDPSKTADPTATICRLQFHKQMQFYNENSSLGDGLGSIT